MEKWKLRCTYTVNLLLIESNWIYAFHFQQIFFKYTNQGNGQVTPHKNFLTLEDLSYAVDTLRVPHEAGKKDRVKLSVSATHTHSHTHTSNYLYRS